MSLARDKHSNNILLGAGEIYIAQIEAGHTTGERYIGDTPSAELSIEAERIDVAAGDGPPRTIESVVTTMTRTLNFSVRDLSMDNLALLLTATLSQLDAVSAPVSEEAITKVRKGYWYQLGVSATRPQGISAVTATGLTVKLQGQSQALSADDNYLLDAKRGRLHILSTAAVITDDATILVSYTAAGVAAKMLKAESKIITAAVRYIEQPRAGTGRNLYIPKAEIRPNGALALKGDNEQQISLSAVTTEAIYIDGQET